MGTDDIHKQKRSTRKTRIENKAVLIALEDTKSSKYYFEALIKDKKLTGAIVFAKHIGTDPNKVLEAIIKHENAHPKEKYEKRWIVIDKDDWSKDQINGTIERARELGICVAVSNEAYELWILLHFKSVTRYMHRTDLNRELNKIFKDRFNIDYAKSSQDIYGFTVGLQATAIKNAKILLKRHSEVNSTISPYDCNPMTMIFELVECLNLLYEGIADCKCFPVTTYEGKN